MTKFKELFSFKKKEIALFFNKCSIRKQINGLKLLYCPLTSSEAIGKMLIITPRSVGNAVQRNLIRRRIKAIFYEEKLFQAPYTWAIIVYQQAKVYSFDQLKSFFKSAIMPLVPANPANVTDSEKSG